MSSRAAAAVDLGSAAQFAVLAGSAVTNTGATTITGKVGAAPGVGLTGFTAAVVRGTLDSDDAGAIAAQADLGRAYDAAAAAPGATVLSGDDLGGLTLRPGVYRFATAAQLTGTLTLDARGDGGDFVFQIGTTLITATNAAVVVLGGTGSHVFYQVGSSATLGAGTAFAGNILALTSITLGAGATLIDGRALARDGAVTMASNIVSIGALPEPATWTLAVAGFGAVGGAMRRTRRTLSFA